MHTVILNVENESMMNKLKTFIADLKEGISIEKDVELLESGDPDYKMIETTKEEKNPSYSLEEARKKLGL